MPALNPTIPEKGRSLSLLDSVNGVLDSLVLAAQSFEGLWPSCLSLKTHRIPDVRPGNVPGQRDGDRSWTGSNLMHDLPALHLMYELSGRGIRPDFRAAADAYLEGFLARCTSMGNGLFLWGEHAFWDLVQKKPGNSALFRPENLQIEDPNALPLIHDHLRMAPPWFWEKASEMRPDAIQHFADGLDRHWINEARTEYNRHAYILLDGRLPRMARSCDFPRHSGHYVVDLACAYALQPRRETMIQLMRYADYWWQRSEGDACLPIESRSPETEEEFYRMRGVAQTLSLGVSLLDAASSLRKADPRVAECLAQRGRNYCQRFLGAPHQTAKGRFIAAYDPQDLGRVQESPLLGSIYGVFPVPQTALLCCAAYRQLGEESLINWAVAAAEAIMGRWELLIAQADGIPALDIGLLYELLADLSELTRDRRWLEIGKAFWPWTEGQFLSCSLVRSVAGGAWYESQLGSAYLLHGMARFALHLESSEILKPDYSAR